MTIIVARIDLYRVTFREWMALLLLSAAIRFYSVTSRSGPESNASRVLKIFFASAPFLRSSHVAAESSKARSHESREIDTLPATFREC